MNYPKYVPNSVYESAIGKWLRHCAASPDVCPFTRLAARRLQASPILTSLQCLKMECGVTWIPYCHSRKKRNTCSPTASLAAPENTFMKHRNIPSSITTNLAGDKSRGYHPVTATTLLRRRADASSAKTNCYKVSGGDEESGWISQCLGLKGDTKAGVKGNKG